MLSTRATIAICLSLVTSLLAGGATAQTTATGEPGTGALTRGTANPILRNNSSYDDLKTGPSSVVKFATGDYRQWYEALDAQNTPRSGDFLSQTAYATSVDGTSWKKQGVVFSPLPAPSWENSEACPTSMHWDGTKWILFYHGGNNSGSRAIGRATSSTGTGGFTRHGPPILQRGAPGAWDGKFVADAKVIPPWEGPDDLWRLYYVGRNAAGQGQVGLATSRDGIKFDKVGNAPVVGFVTAGASDLQAFTPEWDRQQNLFRAWYVASSSIGYLWSYDGVNWSRGPANPVLGSVAGDSIEDSVDSYLDNGRYRIVYGQYDLGATPALRGKGEAWSVQEKTPVPPPPAPTPPPPGPTVATAAFAVSASGDDGDVERGSASYPPTSTSSSYVQVGDATVMVRRSSTPWSYQPVRVALLRFDTSSLPDGATITSAQLQLAVTGKSSTDRRNLVAEWYPGTSWPADSTDWTVSDSSSAHAGTPLDSISVGQQVSFPLQNLSSIDRMGSTALRVHVSGAATPPTGANDLAYAAHDHQSLPGPTLLVQYQIPG